MCSRFLSFLFLFVFLFLFSSRGFSATLRVCAEPDNLPYSHEDGSGFENRLARLLAAELGRELVMAWQPQRRGFVRKTVGAGLCDAWMGVPSGFERMLTTRPYYRSSFFFIFKSSSPLVSFEDPRLKSLRIGVQLPGDDLAATPPGHALALRGARNVAGYTVYGERPAAARIVDAIARGELDAGLVWGPQAGYFARGQGLALHPAAAPEELRKIPFEYSISVGVKRGERGLRDALEAALERRRGEIGALLDEYAVPRLP
jgi:mxaJ protein